LYIPWSAYAFVVYGVLHFPDSRKNIVATHTEGNYWQLMCEQIRQYTIGILSMDARYMSPEEVMPASL
jgi:hypothetical protein